MTDTEGLPDEPESEPKAKSDAAETWYGVVEFVGWFLEAIFWVARTLVAAVVALLHSCS